MPIVVLHRVVTPPPPPPPDPIVIQPGYQPGQARATWIAPDGTTWVLDNPDPWASGWFTPDAVAGLGASPIDLVTDDHPRGGARIRHTQDQPRIITWPLYIEGRTHLEFVQRWWSLADAFLQTQDFGPARLQIARPDGSVREILAHYQAGWDGEPGQGNTYDTVAVSLFCEDPHWRSLTPVTIVREFTEGGSFFNPFITVSDGRVLGDTTLVNEGTVQAWPVWTIRGPATELTAANQTTGESFVLTYNLAAGQTITITTDPGTVRGPAGQVLTGSLNYPGAVLWGLRRGLNRVSLSALGAGAGTRIEMTYYPRHRMA